MTLKYRHVNVKYRQFKNLTAKVEYNFCPTTLFSFFFFIFLRFNVSGFMSTDVFEALSYPT